MLIIIAYIRLRQKDLEFKVNMNFVLGIRKTNFITGHEIIFNVEKCQE